VAAECGWKLFDMFIGALQALIFSLLTIMYFKRSGGRRGRGWRALSRRLTGAAAN